MFRYGIEAAKTKFIGDFLKSGGPATCSLRFQDEVENLLLFTC